MVLMPKTQENRKMALLYYESLPGVGRAERTLKDTGAQLRPYHNHLAGAIKAAKRSQQFIAWRAADHSECKIFNDRLDAFWNAKENDARKQKKRRNRRVTKQPKGHWIILEAPPWQPELPDAHFEAFLEADSCYESPSCRIGDEISIHHQDTEGLALLVGELPRPYNLPDKNKDGADTKPPSADAPYGNLIWLRINTYGLERQQWALRNLENGPTPRLAPLIRLLSSHATWEPVAPKEFLEDEWLFLRRGDDGNLRDGTEEQRQFVRIASATPDFALLEGPPGSGKTTAICELIVQLLRKGQRVMLVASTHVAVDNVLERLLEWQDTSDEKLVLPVRIGDEKNVTSEAITPFILRQLESTWRAELTEFLDDPQDVTAEADEARSMLRASSESPLLRLILDSANLVCGTTIGILQHPLIKAANRGETASTPFDMLILDEASKTTFTEFLVPALHASRWVVVGDEKQLSPYVEQTDLEEGIKRLVDPSQANLAVHAFCAGLNGWNKRRSLLKLSDKELNSARRECESRKGLHSLILDNANTTQMYGGIEGIPQLLYTDLVVGTAEALQRYQDRLPPDLQAAPEIAALLPNWDAARRACSESASEPITWQAELAWRLVRSYELRDNPTEKERFEVDIRELMPKSLNETSEARLIKDLHNIRRVALPSILGLLQSGFERLPNWKDQVALTDGLPSRALEDRLVSLSYQHRMHPDIAAFPREHFYTTEGPDESLWVTPQQVPTRSLLKDASGMEDKRNWAYARYRSRAHWLNVTPRRDDRGNSNQAEADQLIKELQAFAEWVSTHGRPGKVYEVACLTFYLAQEKLLRQKLQDLSRQRGNTRNFRLAEQQVKVTLCTVDRFQGHEADLVLLSMVKSGTVGFLNSPNRLNVALTRARFQLVVIGHRDYFKSERCRSELLKKLASSEHYTSELTWGTVR